MSTTRFTGTEYEIATAAAHRVWDGIYRVTRTHDDVWRVTLYGPDGPVHHVKVTTLGQAYVWCHESHGCGSGYEVFPGATWILGVTNSRSGVTRYLPRVSFGSADDAMRAMLAVARKRYADVACYCGQGEACACGGWVSGPLSLIRELAGSIGQMGGASDDWPIRVKLPYSVRLGAGRAPLLMSWEATRIL